eukprot:6209535-Pleurochrysis_carterae.AAC.1
MGETSSGVQKDSDKRGMPRASAEAKISCTAAEPGLIPFKSWQDDVAYAADHRIKVSLSPPTGRDAAFYSRIQA